MALFYLFVLLLLLFGVVGAVVYFFTDWAEKLKYTIIGALVVSWISMAGYTYYQNQKRIYLDKVYYEFSHDRVLECKDPFGEVVRVDRRHFDFVSGTMVFVGRPKGRYAGLIVPLEQCRIPKD